MIEKQKSLYNIFIFIFYILFIFFIFYTLFKSITSKVFFYCIVYRVFSFRENIQGLKYSNVLLLSPPLPHIIIPIGSSPNMCGTYIFSRFVNLENAVGHGFSLALQ